MASDTSQYRPTQGRPGMVLRRGAPYGPPGIPAMARWSMTTPGQWMWPAASSPGPCIPSGNRRSTRGHVMPLGGGESVSCITVWTPLNEDPTQDPSQFLGPALISLSCQPAPSRWPRCRASQENPTGAPSKVGRKRRIGFGGPLSSKAYGR